MSLRIDRLTIPDFANTEEAVTWGAKQSSADLRVIRAVYKTLERIALTTNDLQRKADYATQAQLIREASESIPSDNTFPHDRSQTAPTEASTGPERIDPEPVREVSSGVSPTGDELINAGLDALVKSFGKPKRRQSR